MEPQEITQYEPQETAIAPSTPRERITLRRLQIVQGTSPEAQTHVAGTWMLTDPSKSRAPEFIERLPELRIVPLFRTGTTEIFLDSRTMWPFDLKTGKPLTGVKKPLCASQDGINPRLGQRDGFVEKVYQDYRLGADPNIKNPAYMIIPITQADNGNVFGGCKRCPLGQWMAACETEPDPLNEGKLRYKINPRTQKRIAMRDERGEPVRLPPPCRETPTYLFWLPDYNEVVVFQAKTSASYSSFRKPGAKDETKALDWFYALDADGNFKNMPEGKPHAVKAQHYVKNYEGSNKGQAHKLRLDDQPLTDVELEQYLAARAFIDGVAFWDRLLGIGNDFQDEDDLLDEMMESQALAQQLMANEIGVVLGRSTEHRIGGDNPPASDPF